jgi:hypothetical protein
MNLQGEVWKQFDKMGFDKLVKQKAFVRITTPGIAYG